MQNATRVKPKAIGNPDNPLNNWTGTTVGAPWIEPGRFGEEVVEVRLDRSHRNALGVRSVNWPTSLLEVVK